ncbi:DUF624 domain-containing protein [Paractinoplanes ferrugineus]|uniref:DUF624 domain-containing protein n=1 Tax=Paractinoplanes ferrugineus TaxID=113564 RepID=A0A919J9Q0_9ACTN|nr:DUF624 domain-containing protein [Actinoplanes ferrugineus]GIE16340.1 hypothetical protein Afe05nite_81800 [Actinoplanes ferrugineus]
MTATVTWGSGPLARAAALLHTLLVVELCLLVTAAPTVAVPVLLDRDASNVPLLALAAVPLGPALSAAVYALRHRGRDLADLSPARAFWRGYRMNVRAVLLLWLPWLGWAALAGTSLGHPEAAGVPRWWSAALVALAAGSLLWQANALVIASLYEFRARDTARLAAWFLIRTPAVTLGTAGLAFAAGAVVVLGSEAVLALFAVVFAGALLTVSNPMRAEIEKRFTR